MKEVSVIVSKCVLEDSDQFRRVGNSVYGDRIVDSRTEGVDEAKALGNPYRAPGRSVLIRPHYNESDESGRFFREWRSFNGEDFKEVRWNL